MLLLRFVCLTLLFIPGKKKGLFSICIKQGHLGCTSILDKLKLGTSSKKLGDILVPVIRASHLGTGPIAINVERSISIGSVVGPVGVAAHEVHLISEEDLAYFLSVVVGVLDEEGQTEERVVCGGLRRACGVVLVGVEAELQGEDQKESNE